MKYRKRSKIALFPKDSDSKVPLFTRVFQLLQFLSLEGRFWDFRIGVCLGGRLETVLEVY